MSNGLEPLEKYQGRDYKLAAPGVPEEWDLNNEGLMRPCARSWVCPRRARFFGDKGCLIINLAFGQCKLITQLQTRTPRMPPYEITNRWMVGGAPCDDDCDGEWVPNVQTVTVTEVNGQATSPLAYSRGS